MKQLQPCPECGTPLALMDMADVVRRFAGVAPSAAPRLEVTEVHERTEGDRYGITARPHTAARCAAAATGSPEPLPPIDEGLLLADAADED